jgi:hypothetical protein
MKELNLQLRCQHRFGRVPTGIGIKVETKEAHPDRVKVQHSLSAFLPGKQDKSNNLEK